MIMILIRVILLISVSMMMVNDHGCDESGYNDNDDDDLIDDYDDCINANFNVFFSRPSDAFGFFMSPLKMIGFLCNTFKWLLIKLLIVGLILLLIGLFFYSMPVSIFHLLVYLAFHFNKIIICCLSFALTF